LLAALVLAGRHAKLQHLGLAYADITDLTLLGFFPNLTSLDLRHNPRLHNLARLRLERLDVRGFFC